MKLARFCLAGDPTPRHAIVEANRVHVLKGPFLGAAHVDALKTGDSFELSAVKLLAPVEPSKIVAVGLNYRAHAAEMKKPVPPLPRLFIKPSTAVVGPLDAIRLPPQSKQVEHEAELAVVMGRRSFGLTLENALDHVLGYTCLNDVTARDLQVEDGSQYTRAKGFDSFSPLGPWIETELDPANVDVEMRVNGVVRQQGNSRDMVFSIKELLVYISNIMTLLPGDVVTTGTPAGVGPLVDGDKAEVVVAGVGTLINVVQAAR